MAADCALHDYSRMAQRDLGANLKGMARGVWSDPVAATLISTGIISLIGGLSPAVRSWLTQVIAVTRIQIFGWSLLALVLGLVLGSCTALRYFRKSLPTLLEAKSAEVRAEERDKAQADQKAALVDLRQQLSANKEQEIRDAVEAERSKKAGSTQPPKLDELQVTTLKLLAALDGAKLPLRQLVRLAKCSRLEAEHAFASLDKLKFVSYLDENSGYSTHESQCWLTDKGRAFVVSLGWTKSKKPEERT